MLNDESNVSYQNISPPSLILDSSSSLNHFNAQVLEDHTKIFGTQDKEFLSVLESIENMNDSLDSSNKVSVTSEGRLSGYFWSETVFNLVERFLLKLRLKSWKRVLILHLFKERLMNPKLEVILKNSAEGYGLNGTLETNLVQTLVTYLMSRVNLSGIHPRVTQRSKFS